MLVVQGVLSTTSVVSYRMNEEGGGTGRRIFQIKVQLMISICVRHTGPGFGRFSMSSRSLGYFLFFIFSLLSHCTVLFGIRIDQHRHTPRSARSSPNASQQQQQQQKHTKPSHMIGHFSLYWIIITIFMGGSTSRKMTLMLRRACIQYV